MYQTWGCRRSLALIVAALVGGAGPALAADAAHQHGVASLQVVVEGSTLNVSLDSPLDNLLGFERGPRSEAERQAVRAMARRFQVGADLALPSAAAGCQLREVVLASNAIDAALLAPASARTTAPASVPAKPAAAPAPAALAGAHADLEAALTFQCSTPGALKSVSLSGLFKAFPRLRQLNAALVAPGVQRGAKLSPAKPDLAW